MKEAIGVGVLGGWRCPTCKRLVKKPTNSDHGRCKVCGEELLFKVFTSSRLPEGKEIEIPVTILKSSDEQGRSVVVNFLNKPLFLRALEDFAKKREIFLTEAIVGFAAKGYKQYLEDNKKVKVNAK